MLDLVVEVACCVGGGGRCNNKPTRWSRCTVPQIQPNQAEINLTSQETSPPTECLRKFQRPKALRAGAWNGDRARSRTNLATRRSSAGYAWAIPAVGIQRIRATPQQSEGTCLTKSACIRFGKASISRALQVALQAGSQLTSMHQDGLSGSRLATVVLLPKRSTIPTERK